MTEKSYNTDTMFCLVSKQTMPNIIPCLQENMKPRTVVLIYTPEMQKPAENIKSIFKKYNNTLAIKSYQISDECADCYYNAYMETSEILEQYTDGTCSLNMTGGTKVLSLATYNAFKDMHADNKENIIFYMGHQTSKIYIMTETEKTIDIETTITVKQYLQAYGYEIKKSNNDIVYNDLKKQRSDWIKDSTIHEFLPMINLIALTSNKINVEKLNKKDKERYKNAIRELKKWEFLEKDEFEKWVFVDEDIRKYVNGEWLEQYIFETLNKNRKQLGIQDILWGVEIKRHTRNNELDIVFTHNNALYIMECKTKRYAGTDRENRNKELYKIFAIKQNLGAIASKSAIISLLPLENENKNIIKERAKDLNIKTFVGDDLCKTKFIDKITEWIKSPQ